MLDRPHRNNWRTVPSEQHPLPRVHQGSGVLPGRVDVIPSYTKCRRKVLEGMVRAEVEITMVA